MPVYTVHEPPRRDDELLAHTARFAFVRDGFSVWAFLLAPLWMLRHRLWLAFVGYVIVVVVLSLGLRAIGTSATLADIVTALFSLLVGFEAATLRRFGLARRGWRNVGIVVGDDVESAERRFFDAWANKTWANKTWDNKTSAERPSVDGVPRASSPAMGVPMARRPSSEVIGLFPQPGAPRGASPSLITARGNFARGRKHLSAPRPGEGWGGRSWGRGAPRGGRAPPGGGGPARGALPGV